MADGALGDMESAGLVDDALALAGAGQLGYDVALSLLRHLPRQQPSLAWVAALPWLSKMSHLLHGTAGSPNPFERWSRGVAADLLLVSDGLHRSTDPVDHAFVSRVRRWACGLGVPGCLGTVTVAAAARTYIELGLNDTDVCGASQSDEEWDTLLSKLIKEDSTLYLKLAECIQSPVVVKKMMELAVEHNYDAADSLVKNLSANPYTFDTLIQYLKNNWMLLHERFGPNFSYDILKATAPYAKNNDHMVEIKKMMSALKKSNPPQSLQEDGSHNIWWLQNQAEKLLHKLQDL